jgi:hypothetical protein
MKSINATKINRKFGFAPNEQTGDWGVECCVSHSSPKQGLNGAPNVRCRCRRQGHCSLNLPQASRLRGMTKFKVVGGP